jgi:uncharacterized protein (DUF2141 family)
MKRKLVLGFAVLLFFGFSAISTWAQTNSDVRITMTGMSRFNGWEVEIYLLTSKDIDEEAVDRNDVKITAGSATFTLDDARPGRYYILLYFVNNRSGDDSLFISNNPFNITRGPQQIVFSRDAFSQLE